MTTYKETVGIKAQNVSSDPPAAAAGQVWYNTDSNSVKLHTGAVVNAWSTGNNLNTGRATGAGVGTQTASIFFGGIQLLNPRTTTVTGVRTEAYNGTAWTEVNDLNTGRRYLKGAGTATAAVTIGGGEPQGNQTEVWNGTNWTEVNNLNTGAIKMSGAGATATAALKFGGFANPPYVIYDRTETWNGTNWTEVNDLNVGRYALAGAGSNTAALAIGGNLKPPAGNVENWNGTNWTSVNSLQTSPARYGLAGTGTNTAALAVSGYAPYKQDVELWNGTNWTEVNNLNQGRGDTAASGSSTAALAAGGNAPPFSQVKNTEEWGEVGGVKTINTD